MMPITLYMRQHRPCEISKFYKRRISTLLQDSPQTPGSLKKEEPEWGTRFSEWETIWKMVPERGTGFPKRGTLFYKCGTRFSEKKDSFGEDLFFGKLSPSYLKPGPSFETQGPLSENRVPYSWNRIPHSGNRVPFFISKKVLQKRDPLTGSPFLRFKVKNDESFVNKISKISLSF